MKLKILNLYAGLGGNRKNWKDVEVTAVEINPTIARYYRDHYKDDKLIIGDAHEYLLANYKEFDFIWSSVPCPSHSRARYWGSKGGTCDPIYPDMKLYQEILFLKHFFNGGWVVENVVPYYAPLIKPSIKIDRHLFWSNFNITPFKGVNVDVNQGNIKTWQKHHDIDISNYSFKDVRRNKVLRNCVHHSIGDHIMNCFLGVKQQREQVVGELNFDTN